MTKLEAWRAFVSRYGDFEARRKARCHRPWWRWYSPLSRDPLQIIWELVHTWPGGSPAQNRKKFASIIRVAIRNARQQRERIKGFCAPGVAHGSLP